MEASTLEKLAQEEKKREEVTSLYLTLKKVMLKRKKIGNNVCKKKLNLVVNSIQILTQNHERHRQYYCLI